MSTEITETKITSDATPHTATAWPVPGEPALWSVTWLPGRALTRDQAITAMTIAETVATHADAQNDAEGRWRPHLASWADELGLSADEATEMASVPLARDGGERRGEPATAGAASEMDAVHAEEILNGRMPMTGMPYDTTFFIGEFLATHPEWKISHAPREAEPQQREAEL